jgi:hypothetical protein
MSKLKKAAIAAAVLIAAMVAFDLGGRAMFPERWKELDAKVAADRAARKSSQEAAAAKKKADKSPSGATIAGGMLAMEMAKAGAVKPTSDQVDALARRSATEMEVQQGDRARFVREFEHGFWVGWKTATK